MEYIAITVTVNVTVTTKSIGQYNDGSNTFYHIPMNMRSIDRLINRVAIIVNEGNHSKLSRKNTVYSAIRKLLLF